MLRRLLCESLDTAACSCSILPPVAEYSHGLVWPQLAAGFNILQDAMLLQR